MRARYLVWSTVQTPSLPDGGMDFKKAKPDGLKMNTQVANVSETLGSQILSELARQKLTGSYFIFRQRQLLRCIDDRQELRETLADWGFGEVDTSGDGKQILEAINHLWQPDVYAVLLLSMLDSTFYGLPSILYWTSRYVQKMRRARKPVDKNKLAPGL